MPPVSYTHLFVITDSTDTQVGLRLAGIEGVVVREEPLVRAAIQTAAADPDIASQAQPHLGIRAVGDDEVFHKLPLSVSPAPRAKSRCV